MATHPSNTISSNNNNVSIFVTKTKCSNTIGYQLPNLGTNSTYHMSLLSEHLYVLLHRLPGCKKNMLKYLLLYL